MPEATEATGTVPEQSKEVSGGNAKQVDADLAAQLERAQSAYKGMQTNYNKLHEQAQAKDGELNDLRSQMEEMRRSLETLTQEREKAQNLASQVQSELEQKAGALESTQAVMNMSKLIDEKFPSLIGMKGILSPRESEEATLQMLEDVNRTVSGNIQAQVRSQIGGNYPPGGDVSRQAAPSPRSLLLSALDTAGTSNFEANARAYYSMLGESGKYPRPPADDALGDIFQ